MNREAITQIVFNELGIILVDKSGIHEDATFSELRLDDVDIQTLFGRLEEAFNFTVPRFMHIHAIQRPEGLALKMVVELIVLMGQETVPDDGKKSGSGNEPGHHR
ncbi:hypothetical protein BW686_18110 [Pseudomonas syringae]|uniref:Acyl carrier protein n=1 Tax=Pseudomonas syringae TaxID=317 RepID=A0A244ENY5_PSESX|nr:hypothetical protein [Pseudomonas syringae]MCI3944577.1 hypothetical protein [Pseudomonas syringae]OUM06187.1 hypothetical protein BW686_18110 [Pseudomonas syringae]